MKTLAVFLLATTACQKAGPSLLDRVPADACAVAVIHKKGIDSVRESVVGNTDAQIELSQFFARTVGSDLTQVSEVVIFAQSLVPKPKPAVLMFVSSPAHLAFPVADTHAGVTVHRVGEGVFAAAISGSIVLGAREPVDAAIDVAQGLAPALGKSAALLRRIPKVAAFGLALSLDAKSSHPLINLLRSSGVRQATATISGTRVVITLEGDAKRLPGALTKIRQARAFALAMLRFRKRGNTEGEDLLLGITAISGYNNLQHILMHIDTKLVEDRLVLKVDMPTTEVAAAIRSIVWLWRMRRDARPIHP